MNVAITAHATCQVALNKLVPSKANVRRTGRGQRIEELAASIAAHGLLQNLTVRPIDHDRYEVVAGGRRLMALKLLAKRRELAKDAAITCKLLDGEKVTEISLAENVGQEPMHPADQYEAFAELHRQGMAAEDIAARFGVTPTVVRQRLKLGAVSPKLMAVYRAGDMNLAQLSAFAITDDHALQERVCKGLGWHRDRGAILEALSEGQVWTNDRRALFVGTEAYRAAGGTIVRDLFDEDGSGYFTDVALLNRLVEEKLATVAESVRAEGWKWVQVEVGFDCALTADMRRIYPEPKPVTEEEQARIDALVEQYDDIAAGLEQDGSGWTEEEVAKAETELQRLDEEIDALHGEDLFRADDIAIAGAFIAVGTNGEARIERGFVRREDDPKAGSKSEDGDEAESVETPKRRGDRLPDSLIAELTAYRTASLANELAQRSDLALVAAAYTLAADIFYRTGNGFSCLDLSARRIWLTGHAKDIGENRAMQEIEARHAEWERRLPEEPAELWAFVRNLPDAERLALLAHCVSLTLDAVRTAKEPNKGAALDHADRLAAELSLDMTAYWQPTAAAYSSRITKPLILKAVREATSPEAAQTCEAMKKPEMAAWAEKLVAGKGWLPEVLR